MKPSSSFHTPVGSSIELTEMRARQVDAILREAPEVKYTVTTINTGAAQGRIYAQVYVRLVDRKDRTRNVDQMSVPLRERLARVPGITVTHVGLLDPVGGQKPISLSVQGTDLAELQRMSADLTTKLRDVPGLVDLDTSMKPNRPTIAIDVKRDAASDAGLSVGSITNTLRALVGGTTVGNWRATDDQNYDVKVRVAPEDRSRIDDLGRLGLMAGVNADGSARIVRLAQVARGAAGHRAQPDQPPDLATRSRADRQRRRRSLAGRGVGRHPQGARRYAPATRATRCASAAPRKTCRKASPTR